MRTTKSKFQEAFENLKIKITGRSTLTAASREYNSLLYEDREYVLFLRLLIKDFVDYYYQYSDGVSAIYKLFKIAKYKVCDDMSDFSIYSIRYNKKYFIEFMLCIAFCYNLKIDCVEMLIQCFIEFEI